ncbi:CDP-alcohol phosphatidyltransferase family protein [Catellatospora sichuanensis]|uniref:CDP-alcohol phosphatidyltransferase family protein n=1 Tax=Catellatospora sichuanensis TaxID=1969805 RepID=UPI001C92240C|nr:CDP-alcohol phosphatidyltransferase family protein [Catellatospora sichuanensis]
MRAGGSFARQMLLVPVGRLRKADHSVATSTALPGLDPVELRAIEQAATAEPVEQPTPTTIPLLPGERTLDRRIKFALVQACTLSSLLLGMTAIFLAVTRNNPMYGALCLLACITFDGLDGALARKFGVASPFGVQMDSLGDMTSFGVAAPVVVFATLQGTVPTPVLIAACAMVACCAAVRLARFNVSPKDGRFFCGVPTTMAATVLAVTVLLKTTMGSALPAGAMVFGVVLLAIAMVSSFPYAKLAKVVKLPPTLFLLPLVGLVWNTQVTFGLLVLVYLLSGPIIWARQRKATARIA